VIKLDKMAGAEKFVDEKIKQRKVMVFAKKQSPACKRAREMLAEYKLDVKTCEFVEIERRQDCTQIENYFQTICLTDTRDVPQLFVDGKYIGGEKEIGLMHESGDLKKVLQKAGVVAY